MTKSIIRWVASLVLVGLVLTAQSCPSEPPAATTGVTKATADVAVQSSGLTVEQENVKRRIELENQPGSIKHLYVISAWSGDVLIYSTVRGKVTSSGKRLTPYTVESAGDAPDGFPIRVDGRGYHTLEVLQDDGTYGSSIAYLYWWNAAGQYHQHYVSGGQIIHVSDQPLQVGDVRINMEVVGAKQ